MVEKIRTALHGQHGLTSATILFVVTLFLSNVLGLLRNIVLTTQSQGLHQLDTYYAAFRLPDLVFNVLILGAISSAFIPVYTAMLKQKGHEEADAMANTLLGNILVVVIVALVAMWIFAPVAIPKFVSNFTQDQQAETVRLTRIMILSPFFFSLSYVIGGVLNAHRRFFSYSIAPLIYNCAIIIGGFLLPHYGIFAVAWAVVAGSALHFLIQLPTLFVSQFRFSIRINFRDAAVRRIIALTIPRTFSLMMTQIALLWFTLIASGLRPGALTIFSQANDLQTTPAIIFGASLATAVFPTLSEAAAEENHSKFRYYLTRTLRMSCFAVIPLAILTFVLRAQVSRLYVGLGHAASWEDTIRMINTLAWFATSFLAQAVFFILARAFYALQDTKRPMIASVIGTLLTIGLAYSLPHTAFFSTHSTNDVASLAWAESCGTWIEAIILLIWLPAIWKGTLRDIASTAAKSFVLASLAGLAAWATLQIIGEGLKVPALDTSLGGLGTNMVWKLGVQGLLAAIVGIATYLIAARLLGMQELGWLRKRGYDESQESDRSRD